VKAYHKELKEAGIVTDRVAPMLLPDYTTPEVREKQLTASYLGTMRWLVKRLSSPEVNHGRSEEDHACP
jgi:hypothetical protein